MIKNNNILSLKDQIIIIKKTTASIAVYIKNKLKKIIKIEIKNS